MPRRRSHAMPTPPVRLVPREGGGLALNVDGVTQSVVGPAQGYWARMIPDQAPARALLLGLGGGTIAHLLAARWPAVSITGIERDERIIAAAREHLGLDALPRLSVIHADVFPWVAKHSGESPGTYDYIAHDLYVGARMVPGALGTPFLRQVAMLLGPGGRLAMNLVRTQRLDAQIVRLRRVFEVTAREDIGGNIILWLVKAG
jgi:spermidine synthase